MQSFYSLIYLIFQLYLVSTARVEVKDASTVSFYAQILYRNEFKCSAIVISHNFLLTTVTCTQEKIVYFYQVLVGSTQKNVGDYRHVIDQIIRSPAYNERNLRHNIALIKLKSSVKKNVKPAVLATRLPSDESTTSVKIYGLIPSLGDSNHPYLVTDVAKVESFADCKKKLSLDGRRLHIEEYCITAESVYPCTEEGAPALIDNKVFAIATYSPGIKTCTSNTVPMSYINIFHYREWIIKTAGLNRSYFPSTNRKAVKVGEASFYAQLLINGSLVCSATVLSSNFLLTTANCVWNPKEDYQVLVGTTEKGKGGKKYSIAEIIRHSEYKQLKHVHNIALIRLTSPMGEEAKPIPLARRRPSSDTSTPVIIYGFAVEDDVTQNNTEVLLLDNEVCIIDQRSCCMHLTKDNRYCNTEISCVYTYNRYPCMEYGSPLIYQNELFAIYSTFEGLNWCQPSLYETPLSYVQIKPYLDWITEHSNLNSSHFSVPSRIAGRYH